jgi:hypothetical protein
MHNVTLTPSFVMIGQIAFVIRTFVVELRGSTEAISYYDSVEETE